MAPTPIALPERVTMSDARATLTRLQPLLADAADPVIDASALVDLDTAAVALLLDCQRQAKARGRVLRVTGAPAKLSQLAQLYGVDALLGLAVAQPASLPSPSPSAGATAAGAA